ncbi:alanine--tRNA ligase [Babesia caballi]|uniref:Alanine--tRNA ligase n=1 Tax=Babesia caballi TaxID=5871 RepID=A0AAV4LNI7_BABCB|nr:alanine--tRNA ligase [Babesia caballi]
MGGKIWKDFVHWHLEQVEVAAEAQDSPEAAHKAGDILELLDPEALTRCRTVDRCLAYTFESYCKLVVSAALQRAQAANAEVVTPYDVLESATRLFRLPDDMDVDAEEYYPHDLERCVCLYRRYLVWYREAGHRIYGRRQRGNLSCQRWAPAVRKAAVEVDSEKFAYVPPLYKIAQVPLSEVFGS